MKYQNLRDVKILIQEEKKEKKKVSRNFSRQFES